MNRGFTIALILTVVALGVASAKLLLGHRGAAQVEAPAAEEGARSTAPSEAPGEATPGRAESTPTAPSRPDAASRVEEPAPPVARPAPQVAVAAEAVERGATRRGRGAAEPPPVPSTATSEAPHDTKAPEESATLTTEMRRELVRRYLQALAHLRD